MWPDRRVIDLLGIELPIIQAPMAGPVFSDMVIAVAEAGGLGSLPCATMNAEQVRAELGIIRSRTSRPINVNFFCHTPPAVDPAREALWRQRLRNYYVEFELDPDGPIPTSNRTPFDDQLCALIEEFRPEVVSFHFGLPEPRLLDRVKQTGAKILSSATTVKEARWLEENGADAIIAQGFEAGGHRGLFLDEDISTQVGTFALVPQVADAVKVPVIAAGGITDARGIVAAFALGASAVQIGTAYLFTPEARLAPPHRAALREDRAEETVLTNIFTGRPARGIVNRIMSEVGPMTDTAPAFPLAGGALAPLREASLKAGSGDFISLWSGQSARLCREMPAGELTRRLASEAFSRLSRDDLA
ncbi:nitronate monooxygenase [Pseudaminobacter sp. 19-2017]|uniref:Nitronate monooxygenase n=1 Tax=Pseudaminobacter soli (ex Zhang et al. 2022) TaxID=2831468 RepID=A0A942DV57_9HYPH|nr:nitronate monooxygenase family protein [Pseudaminobacter soli]MBS3647339.1 nitronate monooxygenase [Pseudaminobacter soli]